MNTKRRFIIVLILIIVVAIVKNYGEDTISTSPLLQINTKMHNAAIRHIAVDAQERWVVTASDDKSVRLWDVKTGTWLKTYRVLAGSEHLGKIYGTAISPDGKTIAAGGFTGRNLNYSVYVFDRQSGEIIHRIFNLPDVINHLTYSNDGNYLVANLGGQNGIRIYTTKHYQLIAKDTAYKKGSYWSDFDNKGRLVTTCDDGKIRLYSEDFKLIQSYNTKKLPFGVAFSPDGRKMVIGYDDEPRVELFRSRNLKPVFIPELKGIDKGNLACVSWSMDGQILFAGGMYNNDVDFPLNSWSNKGRGALKQWNVALNTILDIHPLKDGNVLIGTCDPCLKLISKNGSIIWEKEPVIVDFRNQINENCIRASSNGTAIAFGFKQWGEDSVKFDIVKQKVLLGKSKELLNPVNTSSLDIKNWENNYYPTLNNIKLELDEFEWSRCLAIASDKKSFVLGTEWALRWYDSNGDLVKMKPAPSIVWAMTISGDEKWLIAGMGDGTLRWYDYKTYTEKIALYINTENKEWILWTPEGFFTASEKGHDLIGYQLNNGFDKAPDFIDGYQLYDAFYRPDLVLAKFRGDDESIKHAINKIGDVRELLKKVRPPKIEFAETIPTTVKGNLVTIPIRITDQGSGIGNLEIRVNGILQEAKNLSEDNLGVRRVQVVIPEGEKSNLTFTIPSHEKRDQGIIHSKSISTEIISKATKPKRKPVLRGLAIGISKYKDNAMFLKHTVNDVSALYKTLETYSSPLFQSLHIKQLIDTNATLKNIEAAFNTQSQNVASTDVFLLYLSGHGVAEDGKFYFLPQDFVFSTPNALQERSITEDILIDFMKRIPAEKLIFIIDACFAGSFNKAFAQFAYSTKSITSMTAIARLMQSSGRVGFFACSDSSIAISGNNNLSLYTSVLLEGLKGAANKSGSYITVLDLASYLAKEVPKISKKQFGFEIFPMWSGNVKGSFELTYVGNQ